MSKLCPKCGKENNDDAKFCEECGTDVSDISNESVSNVKSKSVPAKIKGFWNKRGKKGKGLIGVCCIGIILFVVMGGMFTPEKTHDLNYSGNGVSFNYTSNYDIQNVTGENGTFVKGTSGEDNFQVSTIEKKENFDQYVNDSLALIEEAGFVTYEKRFIQIDGVKAFKITFELTGLETVNTVIAFDKNNKRYVILFSSKNVPSLSEVSTVTDSFKVL